MRRRSLAVTQRLFGSDRPMPKSPRFLSAFWRQEGGAIAAEYALILGIIVVGLAIAVGVLDASLFDAMDNASECVGDGGNCPP